MNNFATTRCLAQIEQNDILTTENVLINLLYIMLTYISKSILIISILKYGLALGEQA
jgi:hypothetical protein